LEELFRLIKNVRKEGELEFDLSSNIEIYDVSFWQSILRDQYGKLLPPEQQCHVDFQKLKTNGKAAAIVIRVGQQDYADSEFRLNWENAKKAGIPRASYWFEDRDVSAKSQAALYWSLIKNDPPEGFIAIDIEWGSHTTWNDWYIIFSELQQLSGSDKIWFYSNYYFFQQYGPKTVAQKEWFSSRFPLWLASYPDNPRAYQEIRLPGTWTRAALWQNGTYDVTGLDYGVWSLEIDHNFFNGGWAQFQRIFGATPTVVEPPVKQFPYLIQFNNRTYKIEGGL
jgi:GH25 family lysozyme M1 (1,4-beta-N-acetylmuramidase)